MIENINQAPTIKDLPNPTQNFEVAGADLHALPNHS